MKITTAIQFVLIYAIGFLLAAVLIYIDPSCKYPKPDTETPMTIPIPCTDVEENN